MQNHKDLEVWKKSIELAAEVYRVTASFPEGEKFGLVSQMRRAAVSVASNIAEGAARQSRKEFVHFLSMAAGSASELNTQLLIVSRIEMADPLTIKAIDETLNLISRMLQGLIRSLRQKSIAPGGESGH